MSAYSLDAYRSIIREALAGGYRFIPFDLQRRTDRAIHLRHDIDYSPSLAVRLAEVNAELGVSGTFFVLLRSQVYNLLAEPTLACVKRIGELGQKLALHATIPAGNDPVEKQLAADFAVFKSALPEALPLFAWHNPTTEVLARYEPEPVLSGLTNAYSAPFFRQIPYYSDSNLRNPPEMFLGLFGSAGAPVMQLLFHPLIWVVGGTTMADVFSGTWEAVVRERELEFRANSAYSQLLPAGMPSGVLHDFAEQWRVAAGRSMK